MLNDWVLGFINGKIAFRMDLLDLIKLQTIYRLLFWSLIE